MIVADWQSYTENRPGHTVTGTVLVYPNLWSPQLHNRRDILVYLPQSEASYALPVIYMQDGQNLFDSATSYAGEWQVDETMQALEFEGLDAIVVGIPNMGYERIHEYSPFRHPRMGGGRGHTYVDFVTQTVKPLIDASFNTLPDRQYTGILGSSMGGLISLYAFFSHPQVFGFVGAMSPAFWFGRQMFFEYVRKSPHAAGRVYLDIGTEEIHGRRSHSSIAGNLAFDMYDLLRLKGYHTGEDLLYIEEPHGRHEEAAWARRLPKALRFLLKV